ncbi:hypothetical protein [Clostridium sp. DJ247]|nr:hypothetical protein [Clostridium sp. DJ247]
MYFTRCRFLEWKLLELEIPNVEKDLHMQDKEVILNAILKE